MKNDNQNYSEMNFEVEYEHLLKGNIIFFNQKKEKETKYDLEIENHETDLRKQQVVSGPGIGIRANQDSILSNHRNPNRLDQAPLGSKSSKEKDQISFQKKKQQLCQSNGLSSLSFLIGLLMIDPSQQKESVEMQDSQNILTPSNIEEEQPKRSSKRRTRGPRLQRVPRVSGEPRKDRGRYTTKMTLRQVLIEFLRILIGENNDIIESNIDQIFTLKYLRSVISQRKTKRSSIYKYKRILFLFIRMVKVKDIADWKQKVYEYLDITTTQAHKMIKNSNQINEDFILSQSVLKKDEETVAVLFSILRELYDEKLKLK